MTPAEFKAARKGLGYSCASLARRWGMDDPAARAIRNWEAGISPINSIAAYCLQLMVEAGDLAPPKPPRPPRPPRPPAEPKPKKPKPKKPRAPWLDEQDRETRILARAMASIKPIGRK